MEYKKLLQGIRKNLENDKQSVHNQIMTMTENHLRFQLFNESRSFSQSCSRNPDIADFCNQCYVFVQSMLIRGLAFDKQKGSISLRNIIHELEEHSGCITRVAYVTLDGIPYEFEEDKKKHMETFWREVEEKSKRFVMRPANFPWKASEKRHARFDKLCAKQTGQPRKPSDTLSKQFISGLWDELQKCKSIGKIYTNYFLAHRQREQATAAISPTDRSLSIDRVENCHEALRNVYNTICLYFFEFSASPVFHKSYNVAKGLDQSWLGSATPAEYKKIYERFEDDIKAKYSKLLPGY